MLKLKKVHKSCRLPFFILVAITAAGFLGACAHKMPPRQEAAAVKATPPPEAATLLRPSAEKVLQENGKKYRIIRTPFGILKRPLEELEETSLAAQSTGKTAPPKTGAPEKPLLGNNLPDAPKPAAASAPATGSGSEMPDKGNVTLNFDDADIYEVIRTMAEVLGINYIVDPTVRGRVTIHTAGSMNPKDLFPVFFQILEANGLTAVKEGAVYKITSLKEAARMPLVPHYGKEGQALAPSERVVMQIVPLKNIQAAEMTKLLTPFVSADGTIISEAASNTLLVVDKGINVLKALRLVEAFDVDLFSNTLHRFFKIEYNAVDDIAPMIKDVLSAYQGSFQSEVKLIPIKHLNMLLVLGQNPKLFDKIAQLLTTLDAPNDSAQPKIYVYAVKNGEADDLAGLLNQIFSQGQLSPQNDMVKDAPIAEDAAKGAPDGGGKPQGNPFLMTPKPKEAGGPPPPVVYGSDLATGTLRGNIKITPDKTRNLLILEALPSDWYIIETVLQRLDILSRQVLIEAMIAEISLDDSMELGVEWRYEDGDGSLTATTLSAAAGAAGLQYVIGQTDRWSATLSALATDNKVNILSAPTVLASNDKEARIDITTEVPVASAQYQYGGSSEDSLLQTNIEYRDTGIILAVTPHINENGMVTMQISQEISEQSGDVIVGDQTYPSFFKRSVTTHLTVGHNQTIVIGGLIRENKSGGKSGVPGLVNIPLLGFLFGKDRQSASKNELIILITPRVIARLSDVDSVTEDFKNKVNRLQHNAMIPG